VKGLLLSGAAGLALGMAAQWMGLQRRDEVRRSVGLMEKRLVRALLMMLGAGTMLTALMMWLAVIDVDTVEVLPMDGGTLLGGIVFGAALGWAGITPGTSAAVLGAGRLLEGVCAVAGCAVGALVLPAAQPVFALLRDWLEPRAATWFQVTLDEPYLFAGGFLGQGCIGLVILAAALCIRIPREPLPEAEPAAPVPPTSDEPQEVQEEAVVVTLPGEEPVVVDTGEKDNEEG
jgi:hypothetical protein